MTGPNIDTYYSRVISLRSIRTIVFLSELNNIDTCAGYIRVSYLTVHTTEKILFNAEPEFEPFGHAVHLLLINTALYGLKSYGARFHYRLRCPGSTWLCTFHGRMWHLDAQLNRLILLCGLLLQ